MSKETGGLCETRVNSARNKSKKGWAVGVPCFWLSQRPTERNCLRLLRKKVEGAARVKRRSELLDVVKRIVLPLTISRPGEGLATKAQEQAPPINKRDLFHSELRVLSIGISWHRIPTVLTNRKTVNTSCCILLMHSAVFF